jgi:serine/threonine protein kinase
VDTQIRNRDTDEDVRVGWDVEPGDELATGKVAWALLGDGVRTETWLAWDVRRWAPVVVKLPRPDLVGSERTLSGLRREAAVHQVLQHPGIQRFFDDELDSSPPHLVLEYVEGPALVDVLDDGPLHPVDVTRLGLQVGSALQYLHASGFLHLDCKPANVLLRDGHAVLIDMGFVRPIGWTAPDTVPRGSPPYMAPEQCRCEPVTERTDLFGFGAFLYELATREPPFESAPSCFEQLQRRARPPRAHVTTLPAELDAIISALLEPAVDDRPPTMAAVLRQLDAALPDAHDPVWPPFVNRFLSSNRFSRTGAAASAGSPGAAVPAT